MNDDISFIPDTISIMSKLKEPLPSPPEEHSFSRIIREQGLNYDQEDHQEIAFRREDRIQDRRRGKVERTSRGGQENCPGADNTGKQIERRDKGHCKDGKSQYQILKGERRPREGALPSGTRSSEKRGNVLLFDEPDNDQAANNHSKKEKRPEKTGLDEQKTKKIEFQDICYKQEQKNKKSEPTRIRQKGEQNLKESLDQYQLEICSKQASENLLDSRDLGILHHRTITNYNTLISQIKEMMAVTRWQYIELEKVEIRKMISKMEAEIRKVKIGFRGLSDSCGKSTGMSSLQGMSKLKSTEDIEGKGLTLRRKPEQTNKVQSKLRSKEAAQHRQLGFDYGLQDGQIPQDGNYKQKIEKLEEQYKVERMKETKFTAKLTELQSKYTTLRANFRFQDSGIRRTEPNPSASIIKRGKLLKEKISFLRGEIKQTKAFYSNKIKRLKNENTIITNEIKYMDRQIDEMKKCAKNVERESKKIVGESTPKQNVMVFEETEGKRLRSGHKGTKGFAVSNKQTPSNIITTVNDVKSLQSLNSMKSIHSFNSKPSLGSLNSHKSTKMQSIEKNSIDYQYPKVKLKIVSPHYLSPPSTENIKQYSILSKRKIETQNRLGTIKQKKSTSLDIAFKQLQEKYKHLNNEGGSSNNFNEYYHNGTGK